MLPSMFSRRSPPSLPVNFVISGSWNSMRHYNPLKNQLIKLHLSIRATFHTTPFSTQQLNASLSAQQLNASLSHVDPEIFSIIENEKIRQRDSVVLIPSENFTSQAVMSALGSVMQNKYSEGYPGARYYGGNEFIDQAERLCQQRALAAFKLNPSQWGVNVQPLSGSPANLQLYCALLQPHQRIMGLDLPHGGHLSHGYQTDTKKISATSIYFETMPYRVDARTGLIDYDMLEKSASLYRPKLIIGGGSAYPRLVDYARMRKIADSVKAYLHADIAHTSGLVAAGVLPSPFDHADVVTTTTHKSLRGPRGAMIFFRKGVRGQTKSGKDILYDLEEKVNFSVFPGHQGGPHNHTIAALAVALKLAAAPEFRLYQEQVLANCQAFAGAFRSLEFNLVSGGTDTHLLLLDLGSKNIDGARVERVLEMCNIAANKNTIPGDLSALVPGGLRIGTPAMTTRGLGAKDFEHIAVFIDRAVSIAKHIKSQIPEKQIKFFKQHMAQEGVEERYPEMKTLKADVVAFSRKFPVIGYGKRV